MRKLPKLPRPLAANPPGCRGATLLLALCLLAGVVFVRYGERKLLTELQGEE